MHMNYFMLLSQHWKKKYSNHCLRCSIFFINCCMVLRTAGFYCVCLALGLFIFCCQKNFQECSAVRILTWRHQSMLAGIAESVIRPAVSHMARVYFHIGALSCITSIFWAVKLSELKTDHSPLLYTEVWNAESFSFLSLIWCSTDKESAQLCPHKFLLHLVTIKNSCHSAKWPRRMTPYSETADRINIEILCLPCYR